MLLTKEQFIDALRSENIFTEKQKRFLVGLATCIEQSATPDQIARKLGYSNKVVVNGLIGGLGKAVAELYGIGKENPEDQWWPFIAGWFREDGDFHWQMHENLYLAMIELNMIPSEAEDISGEDSTRDGYEYYDDEVYSEGHSNIVYVNRYERNRKARNVCIAHYGVSCQVCGFDFEEIYGRKIGEGYIHVHHLIELSSIGEEYEVDPVADLRPVCPNCHAMIHRRRPAFSLEYISDLISKSKK